MKRLKKILLFGFSSASLCLLMALDKNKPSDTNMAFKVYGVTKTVNDVVKNDQSTFYEIEKRKYELLEEMAKGAYLKKYWENLGKTQKVSPEKAEQNFMESKVQFSDSEVKETLSRYKDQLSKFPKEEQEKQVKEYLKAVRRGAVLEGIVEEGIREGNLVVLYPKPAEPVYDINITDADHVRYGPGDSDTNPLGCKGDACPITVVEYSEYQCPYCEKVLDDTKKTLDAFKGKIRWVVRDFPLDFHPKAMPAALAAKCASFQGKFWPMYYELFQHQRTLTTEDFDKISSKLKLNTSEFKKCYTGSDKAKKMVTSNVESGRKLGVTGTPAFFINGRKLSGALPFNEFKKIIEEEMKKKKG